MLDKIDICYAVTHGFAARMVLQTGLLGRLVEEGHKVGIIVPDGNDENLVKVCKKQGITIIEIAYNVSFWEGQINQIRKYFLEDIKSNPCIYEKHMLRMNDKKRSFLKFLQPRLGIFIYSLVKKIPSIRKMYKKREQVLFYSKKVEQVLAELNPKLLLVTYPVMPPEPQLLLAAKKLKIRSVIHLLSWDNITAKGQFPALADEYIVWGNIMAQEFEQYYKISKDKIYICGVPHFDLHIDAKRNPQSEIYVKELGLNPSKPYLFFAMSAPRFAPREIDNVEWIAKQISDNQFGKDLQFIIRPHPQNMIGEMADFSWLPRLQKLDTLNRIAVDYPNLVKNTAMRWSIQQSDMKRLSHLLAGSSIVLNSGSTVSIDALMVGKPVILTSFDADEQLDYWKSARRLIDYTHLKKFIALGGVKVADSFIKLEEQIKNYLTDPNQNLDKRKFAIQQECFKTDGLSTQRVVEKILESYEKIL